MVGISKKQICSNYKCKKIVYNKITMMCKSCNWERLMTNECLWDQFRESEIFHKMESGSNEKKIHDIYIKKYSIHCGFKQLIKNDIKKSLKN